MFSRIKNKLQNSLLHVADQTGLVSFIVWIPSLFTSPISFVNNLIFKLITQAKSILSSQVYNIQPTNRINQLEIKRLLNNLDELPDGRKGLEIFNRFQGNSVFATTGNDAKKSHNKLAKYMLVKDYNKLTEDILDNFLKKQKTFDLNIIVNNVSILIRSIFAERILGIKKFPEKLNLLFDSALDECNFYLGASPLYLSFSLFFNQHFKKTKTDYYQFIQELFTENFEEYFSALRDFPNNVRNLVIDEIVELIKKDNSLTQTELDSYLKKMTKAEFKKYLFDPAILNVPFFLIATENLIKTITGAVSQIVKPNDDLPNIPYFERQIKSEFLNPDGTINFNKLNQNEAYKPTIKGFIRNDNLKSAYLESLRFFTGPVAMRYTNKQLVVGDVTIPKNSMFCVNLGSSQRDEEIWNNPDKFLIFRFDEGDKVNAQVNKFPLLPFSTGNRACPAINVSKRIYEIFIIKVIQHYTLMHAKVDQNNNTANQKAEIVESQSYKR